MSILPIQPAEPIYRYNAELSEADLLLYLDEVANEQLVAPEDLIAGSEQFKNVKESVTDYLESSIPSLIPAKINRLNKLHSKTDTPENLAIERVAVYQLKNELIGQYILPESYNGLCVDLDTTKGSIIIPLGSTLAAL